jgi:uncharacterized membrane protein
MVDQADQGDAAARLDRQRGLARVVDRNVRALVARRAAEDRRKNRSERVADRITGFTGSMRFVYIHLLLFGTWIVVNVGLVPGLPRFDPSFVILAMTASVEAIFLSTFVLISQNRMAELADQRADLDLQVSLLAEHEISRMLALVHRMAEKLGIDEAADPELHELAQDVHPEAVLDKIEENADNFGRDGQPRREQNHSGG